MSFRSLPVGALLCAVLAGDAVAQTRPSPLAWPQVTRESRPWTRWWWMGSAVDSANLKVGLEELAAAGFGGVEVTAIYGVRGAESAYVPYLSDQWVQLLRYTIDEARGLGMSVDMPPGSGWRTGGPSVLPADANASLRITTDTVSGGHTWSADLSGRHVDAVVAMSDDGRTVELSPAAAPLKWQAPAGQWTVYVAETRFSGDNVKRPAPGGEGFAIDVFSRTAVRRFLHAYGARLAMLPRGALRSYFHDSFEYTGSGTPELFRTFRRARGYDLRSYVPALAGRGDSDVVARVKSDYRQTLDELLLEHFVRPLTEWSHARGSLSRNQAHGSPGNLLDLYAASDIPETEIFGPLDTTNVSLLINKFASSAAHVTGKPLASAEAFTWLGEHFTGTLDDVKRAADGLLLAGINHLVYHGTAYSPHVATWPGWQFYASTEFNVRNAFWRDLPAFNQYVTRVQSVLQSGRPDNDVLLYWPVWDSWHATGGMRMDFRVHDATWLSDQPIGKVAASLWQSGVGFDYVSDRQLAQNISVRKGRLQSAGGQYSAIVVPRTEHIPPETMRRLLDLTRAGATLIFIDRLPPDVPGLSRLAQRRRELATMLRQISLDFPGADGMRAARVGRGRVLVGPNLAPLLAGVRREPMVDHPGVHFLRQRTMEGHVYFISNARGNALDGWVPLATRPAAVAIMDPLTGRSGLAELRTDTRGATEVYLQLASGSSLLLRAFDKPVAAMRWAYRRPTSAPIAIRGQWTVRFVDGGPVLPAAFHSDLPVAWTGRGDADADRFAGTARYTLRFDAPSPDAASNYLLDLGLVASSARVRLNDRDAGVLFSRPFIIETGALRPTDNVLEIDVTNLSANRIKDLDVREVPWKIYRDINFVGIDYKPFDASKWPIRPAGLLGPVTLQPLESASPR